MRRYYPKLHQLIAVSQGVADDVITITGMSDTQVTVVRNPTVTPAMLSNATLPVEHPWFAENAPPVVLGVGRLTEQKDFPTLLRAFSEVVTRRDARLIILGEGQLRETLLEQAQQLGIADKMAFPVLQTTRGHGCIVPPFSCCRRDGKALRIHSLKRSPSAHQWSAPTAPVALESY